MAKVLDRLYLRDQIAKYEMRLSFQNTAISRIEKTGIAIAIDSARYLHTIIERKLTHLHQQRHEIENTKDF